MKEYIPFRSKSIINQIWVHLEGQVYGSSTRNTFFPYLPKTITLILNWAHRKRQKGWNETNWAILLLGPYLTKSYSCLNRLETIRLKMVWVGRGECSDTWTEQLKGLNPEFSRRKSFAQDHSLGARRLLWLIVSLPGG